MGTFFYLESIDPSQGAPSTEMTRRARRASMASSLETTAWGILFPDLVRALLPSWDLPLDRAWAMERAWMRAWNCMRMDINQDHCVQAHRFDDPVEPWMSHWRSRTRSGDWPSIVFNSTFVEDGKQFQISTIDLSYLFNHSFRPWRRDFWSYAPIDPTLKRYYPVLNQLNVPAITAARLSATFPIITPMARASRLDLPSYHVTDGGFFDNSGSFAAVQWIYYLSTDLPRYHWCRVNGLTGLRCEKEFEKTRWPSLRLCEPDGGSRPDCGRVLHPNNRKYTSTRIKYLFIQIDPFPPEDYTSGFGEGSRSWVDEIWDPIQTLVNVRSSTQAARTDLELAILKKISGTRLEAVSIRPPQFLAAILPCLGSCHCETRTEYCRIGAV